MDHLSSDQPGEEPPRRTWSERRRSTMKQFDLKVTVVGLSLLSTVFASLLHGEDNSNLVVNGYGTNIPGDLIIGNTGTNNTLHILAAGSVTNVDGYIGFNAGAERNSALV